MSDVNLADRSGNLVESHKGYDPRIIFFYFVLAALLVTLAGGLAYQQLIKTALYSERERQQNQRRVIVPGPRGNIYDRNGKLLVTNRAVFSVVLYVDELLPELHRERSKILKNYRAIAKDPKDIPSRNQLEQIARVAVTQRYLDRVIKILGRDPNSAEAKINAGKIKRHFSSTLVLPYTLLDDLSPSDYAKLLEELEVNSPLQVYTSSARDYPYHALASHVIGYVRPNEDTDDEDFPGDDLTTFKMKGASGKAGLEKQFDDVLQGTSGGSIFRVNPSGFRINPPLAQLKPKQGKNITTSLDVDLQEAAEIAIGDQVGAAVALDVRTGEVLVLASKPDFGDLNEFGRKESMQRINEQGGWLNRATSGTYPPGSTFKTIVTVAGLRTGRLDPHDTSADCMGSLKIGNRFFRCDNGLGRHGRVDLVEALAVSCDTYYWHHGVEDIGIAAIAAEARRFHLGQPTGLELSETKATIIPDPEWKKKYRNDEGPWSQGDTANTSIGQGFVVVTPLQMACVAASIARGETYTRPTLIHDPNHPAQHTDSLGLTPEQYRILVDGMVQCTSPGPHHTASTLSTVPALRIPGIPIAGKTGTAQHRVSKDGKIGYINYAWFICFAPAYKPEIAMAVMLEGDTVGEAFAGGDNAAPVAAKVMKTYFEKKEASGKARAVIPFQMNRTPAAP